MSNGMRYEYGRQAVKAGTPDYVSNNLTGDEITNVIDALTNIMHYCDIEHLDFLDACDAAEAHFRAEINEEYYDEKGE